jgi:hypothetical protein
MSVSLRVPKPKGLTVNSPGRKPRVQICLWSQSPNGATVRMPSRLILSPRWGFQSLSHNQPGACAPGYLLSPLWGSK